MCYADVTSTSARSVFRRHGGYLMYIPSAPEVLHSYGRSRLDSRTKGICMETSKPIERRASVHLIRLGEAAAITGLPVSLLRKSFMSEARRPPNVPDPPPHK